MRLKRPLQMSFGTISQQQVLLVRTLDADGIEGVGEALVMGGPYWNADTIEGIRATVDIYASPHIVDRAFDDVKTYSAYLHRLFRGNGAARTALEMSFLDLAGKKAKLPSICLLGERQVRESIPVSWTLHSDNLKAALSDGEQAILERGHRMFKLKVGIYDPAKEVAYVGAIAKHFEGRAEVLIDANQAWTAAEAVGILQQFSDAGVAVVEQPIPGHDVAGMARIVKECRLEVLADEAILGPPAAHTYAIAQAATGFSLKPQRDGGLIDTMRVAECATQKGWSCYGGTMLETSIGTAALGALYATVPDLRWGCELFGPLRLENDLVVDPIIPVDGCIRLPAGPGLGIVLDEDRIRHLATHGDR